MIYYPPKLNLEQSSSQVTAQYKASLISGQSIIDCTGGFGIDCVFFAETFGHVTHCELHKPLSKIAAHNFKTLGLNNVKTVLGDGIKVASKESYDVIYADPSRRHETKGKVFYLKDCEPNIPEHLALLFKSAPVLLIKTSPMLDIAVGMKELTNVAELHIVAVNNDVKELLWLLKRDFNGNSVVKTINFKHSTNQVFNFQYNLKEKALYGTPERYLYEPNAAILKSGSFQLVSAVFKLKKLAQHTHLYTNDTLFEFPGRRFKIHEVIPYTKKSIRKKLNLLGAANVTTRNFPETVASLRTKWKLKDGGTTYLFFTTLHDGSKTMLVCEKV